MLYRKGGRNRERNCRIPRISPPPTFCTKAKVAKGGAYLRDTTVLLVLFYGLHTSAVFAGVFYPFVNGFILVGY